MIQDVRKVKPLPLSDAHWTHGFWSNRFQLCSKPMIDSMEKALHEKDNGAYMPNFDAAAGLQSDRHYGANWSDGDCYKFIEACSHVYSVTKDTELDLKMDKYIEIIAQAQEPDGYLNTQIQLSSRKRWSLIKNHENYNFGHLFTAATVHYLATGKETFLQVAIQAADYLNNVFNPCPKKLIHFGYNCTDITGLIDLFRITGMERYLELANIFITIKGAGYGGEDQNQDRTPLREESEAIGHAVTSTYLYGGASDVYAHTGEPAVLNALVRIWNNMYSKKMYLTGGVGAIFNGLSRDGDDIHEAFGNEYQLPNRTGYNETCANIANAMWSQRMFHLTNEPKYMDVVERVVYNSLLAAMSLDGTKFCYTNPLAEREGDPFDHKLHTNVNSKKQRWFKHTCYCCPPQVLRTVAQLHNWAYGQSTEGLYIHLYDGSELSTLLDSGERMELKVATQYPFHEHIRISIHANLASETSIFFRIPSWANGATLHLNGNPVVGIAPGTYYEIRRKWQSGDVIELVFPLKISKITAHPKLEETRGQIAFMYGPFVYCLEQVDLPEGISIDQVRIPYDTKLEIVHDEQLLNGVTYLTGKAVRIEESGNEHDLYRSFDHVNKHEIDIQMIPYYAWNNRGITNMSVWLPLI